MQFDPDHLSALAAILRRGSFDAAASELGVTPSAISQRIRTFEDRIGAALINRGSPCSATPIGARIARHAEDIGLLEARLARDLGFDTTADRPVVVRIAVNADSLATWFVPALAAVPEILFDLVIDDQDHSAEWLQRGEVSAAVTSATRPVTGCDTTALGSLRYIATASPGFMAKWFPHGVTAQALAQAPCLTFNQKDTLQRRWAEARTGGRIAPPCHYLPSTHAFIDAACAGLGWGMNPEMLVRRHIQTGGLGTLAPAAPLDVPLAWQVSRIIAPALGPLTQAVKAAAARGLGPA
ncbi:LysR family transcriptional regulator ArgP [Pseudooceanicola sp.]|uniref:LysR family transcriptional regulator ArgP n=1 Tax=Pseudooceanicola sp. TaxID=1914328 RepID=UPI003514E5F4